LEVGACRRVCRRVVSSVKVAEKWANQALEKLKQGLEK
jgi:hypothetical protein